MQACLPIGACDAADAWIAVRQLGEACSQGGKWQQALDAGEPAQPTVQRVALLQTGKYGGCMRSA